MQLSVVVTVSAIVLFLLLHLFSFIFYCETMACSVATLWNNWLVQNLIEGLKEEHSFEMEIFCNIINVFTGTFDQFNAFLLNKTVNYFEKKNMLIIKPETLSLWIRLLGSLTLAFNMKHTCNM